MKTIIIGALLSLGLIACSTGKTEKTTDRETTSKEVSGEQKQSTIDTYMALKDALVKSDAAVAQSEAETLSAALSEEKMDASLIQTVDVIASSSDIKEQRTQFKKVTDGLIATLKANGTEEGVYVQYCPMAFDNAGANWLSRSDEIRNPYFGEMMLKCGKVIEKL